MSVSLRSYQQPKLTEERKLALSSDADYLAHLTKIAGQAAKGEVEKLHSGEYVLVSEPGGAAAAVRNEVINLEEVKRNPNLPIMISRTEAMRSSAKTLARGVAKRNGKRKRGRRGGKRVHKGVASRLPPQLDVLDVVPFHRRYLAGSTSSATFTRGNIVAALGGICTVVNSTVTCWASSFRLTRITAWPAAGTDTTLSWSGGTAEQALQRDRVTVNTLPTGITVTGGQVFSPPKKSYLSDWQVSTSNPTDILFTMAWGSGTVIDVEGVYTLGAASASGFVGGLTWSPSSAVLGSAYYAYLDGVTSHILKPQGLETTF